MDEKTGLSNKENQVNTGWPGPRTVIVPRTENGFGFTLRHFIVYPPESAIQALQKEGSLDGEYDNEGRRCKPRKLSALEPMDTIFVKQVKDGGPAQMAGLNTGDRIVSVNGESVTGKTYSQVIALIQASDRQLKLLVVPKDEDILQMAYHTSAHNPRGEKYRVHANEIPNPPPYSRMARMQSASYATFQGNNASSSGYRELDTNARPRPYTSDAARNRNSSSSGSLTSLNSALNQRSPTKMEPYTRSNSGSSAPLRTITKNIAMAQQREYETQYGSQDSLTRGSDNSNMRRSRENLMRQSQENLFDNGSRSNVQHSSMDTVPHIQRSRENIRHSSENLYPGIGPPVSQSYVLTKSATSGGYMPPPNVHRTTVTFSSADSQGHYTPAPAVFHPVQSTAPSGYSPLNSSGQYVSQTSTVYPSSYSSQSEPRSPPLKDIRFLPAYSDVSDTPSPGELNRSEIRYLPAHGSSRRYRSPDPQTRSTPSLSSVSKSQIDPNRANYLTVGYRHETKPTTVAQSRDLGTCYLKPPEEGYGGYTQSQGSVPNLTKSQSLGFTSHSTSALPSHTHRSPETTIQIQTNAKRRPRIVSERKKLFEMGQSGDSLDSGDGATPPNSAQIDDYYKDELEQIEMMKQEGKVKSVALRTAMFESKSRETADEYESDSLKRRRLSADMRRQFMLSPAKPLTIQDYNKEAPHSTVASYSTPVYSSPSYSSSLTPPSASSPYGVYAHPSQAVTLKSFPQGSKYGPTSSSEVSMVFSPQYSDSDSISSSRGTITPDRDSMRDRAWSDDQRLTRRVVGVARQPSYLNAVSAPKIRSAPPTISEAPFVWSPMVMSNEDSSGSNVLAPSITTTAPPGGTSTSVVMRQQRPQEDDDIKLYRRTSYLMATKDKPAMNLPLEDEKPQCPPIAEPEQATTPTKQTGASNMKKIKAFFGERTPRILEAKGETSPTLDGADKDGALNCKVAVADGKRASDRSWKTFWVVLRGHLLYLYKEKREKDPNSDVPALYDEAPINIASSMIDIAYDYTKRKNVFRLTTYNGSEFLFQAEDQESMLSWIRAIQTNNNPDNGPDNGQHDEAVGSWSIASIWGKFKKSVQEKGGVNTDLIIRKTNAANESCPPPHMQTKSPQVSHKPTKKTLSTLTLRAKSPGAHSPAPKHKKNAPDESPKSKETKTWKGKVVKSFKRFGSSSSSATVAEEEEIQYSGMFAVPLELCTPSPLNEFIPIVVHICTTIVEAKGLETVGIYRVPGNKAAVNSLEEELNRGVDQLNLENEKWFDVNVISSLLKSFLRKLPDPLITEDLYHLMINANRLVKPEKRMLLLKKLLHDLPEHHFETLQFLAAHLHKIADNGDLNKMDSRNLAIVFGPTIIRTNDEDVLLMVRDMSDQCKIIESIIQHNEWFFSSWDVDNEVPVDLVASDQPTTDAIARTTSEEDHDESQIRTRDLVANIISAANKKVTVKGKKDSTPSPPEETDADCGFNERNIDLEVSRRKDTIQLNEVSSSSSISDSKPDASSSKIEINVKSLRDAAPSSRGSSAEKDAFSHKNTYIDPEIPSINVRSYSHSSSESRSSSVENNLATVNEETDREPSGKYYVAKYPGMSDKDKSKSSEENSPTRERNSDAMYLNKTYGSNQMMQDRLRMLDQEKEALRKKNEESRIEHEKRERERQKIEDELQKTKMELENEENDIDLKNYTNKLRNNSDDASVSSDISTTSSANNPLTLNVGFTTSDYSSAASPTLTDVKSPLPATSDYSTCNSLSSVSTGELKSGSPSGTYFQLSSKVDHSNNNVLQLKDSESKRGRRSPRLVSSSRSWSFDSTDFDTQKVVTQGNTARQRRRMDTTECKKAQDDVDTNQSANKLIVPTLGRSGSLDSLRDFYDQNDTRNSYTSSNSDDGSDLLSSITATLDLKYKLNGNSANTKRSKSSSNSSQSATSKDTTKKSLAKHVPITEEPVTKQQEKPTICVSKEPKPKLFRDPSLHRLKKSETIIGIASRFERPSEQSDISPCRRGSVPVNSDSSTVYRRNRARSEPRNYNKDKDNKSKTSVDKKSNCLSKVDKTEANRREKDLKRDSSSSSHSNQHSVSSNRSGSSSETKDKPSLKTLTIENTYHSTYTPVFPSPVHNKSKSASPQVKRRKNKKVNRRHTVGGTKDIDHFKALMQVILPSKADLKLTAWERLKPTQESPLEEHNLKSWIQKERLRTSNPDMFRQLQQSRSGSINGDINSSNSKTSPSRNRYSGSASSSNNCSPSSKGKILESSI
ncbi:unnamed protein product [Owenia fusiformis]|uniref:Uncharacterized protein n=1 Tax=Owenia fusiformis TaxID=6347 RepID=A0A8J1TRQ3_OWEFU|nr:unnamed protein product [Owenia fusiformis]